ncbi:MAG: ATP-binding protein [Rhodothermales bacterium]|nr:ATP-binding protein [Rhodothermales bacterium]MBO6778708.1 ATP-binding protein [Rhodothermales bacterium]
MESAAYRTRIVDKELDELLPQLPAISLEGPKGVGKTETASRRAATTYQLDRQAQFEVMRASPDLLTEGTPPILIDEWQRIPESWDAVRRAVDDNPAPGRFLLTGSASPSTPPTHSGAARIVSVRMRPYSLQERDLASCTVSLSELLRGEAARVSGACDLELRDYTEEIVRSGFPAIRRYSGRALRAQLDSYIQRLVDRDFPEAGYSVRRPQVLKAWLAAYAAGTATSASYETIRDAATPGLSTKPTRAALEPYRDALERMWVLDSLPAWLPSRNPIARLTRPPKHHLADPALAAVLLGVDEESLLTGVGGAVEFPRDGTLLGHLFESLVTQSVRVYAQQAEARVWHLRTKGGRREIDLIVERRDQRVVALEVKLGGTVDDSDVKHLTWLKEQLGDDLLDAVVVNTGPAAYRRPDGIAVVPAALLGA